MELKKASKLLDPKFILMLVGSASGDTVVEGFHDWLLGKLGFFFWLQWSMGAQGWFMACRRWLPVVIAGLMMEIELGVVVKQPIKAVAEERGGGEGARWRCCLGNGKENSLDDVGWRPWSCSPVARGC